MAVNAIPDQREYGGADAVASMVRCSPRHVANLDRRGEMPTAIRVGHLKRWNLAEIRAWLDAGAPSRAEWEQMRRDASADC